MSRDAMPTMIVGAILLFAKTSLSPVKTLFVLLTFGGFACLWAAIAADMGVSLVVISNALRLLRTHR